MFKHMAALNIKIFPGCQLKSVALLSELFSTCRFLDFKFLPINWLQVQVLENLVLLLGRQEFAVDQGYGLNFDGQVLQ